MNITDQELLKNTLNFNNCVESPILLSILFYNSKISLKLKLLIEKAVQDTIQNYFKSDINNNKNDQLNEIDIVSEQKSAIIIKPSSINNYNTDKFDDSIIVTNCSHIYDNMVIDRVGIPLIQDDPLKTIWYGTPHFESTYLTCLTDSKNNEKNENFIIEPHISKCCFNCDGIDHELSNCPIPKDFSKINSKRLEFMNLFSTNNLNDLKYRYHDDSLKNNLYEGCEPGKLSKELRLALNINEYQLPLYIYRMRIHGYPPGYKEQNNKKIDMIGNESDDGEISEDNEENNKIKEIEYPGYNRPLPKQVIDDGPRLGYPPIKKFKNIIKKQNISSPEIIFIEKEPIIKYKKYLKQRKWYTKPLEVNIFAPKATWRRPPMLETNEYYKEPIIDINDLKNNKLIKIDSSCMIFGDQCIPTERLKNIQNILQKRKKK